MQFLNRFRSRWAESWDDFRLRFAAPAPPTLPLARFIYESNKMAWSTTAGIRQRVAKAVAFEPPPNLKLSVFRTDDLTETVWRLAAPRVMKGERQDAIALASFEAKVAMSEKLEALMDNRPDRHVTIRRWPPERYDRLAIQTKLADAAVIQTRSA